MEGSNRWETDKTSRKVKKRIGALGVLLANKISGQKRNKLD